MRAFTSSSVRGLPIWNMSPARRDAVAPLESPCITNVDRMPVRARSISASSTPSFNRRNSAKYTSSVSAARSAVVPAYPRVYPNPLRARYDAFTE